MSPNPTDTCPCCSLSLGTTPLPEHLREKHPLDSARISAGLPVAEPEAAGDRPGDIEGILKQRIMILDGAMGTMIQTYGLSEEDFRGDRFKDHPKDLKGNNDLLILTRPDAIEGIHRAF